MPYAHTKLRLTTYTQFLILFKPIPLLLCLCLKTNSNKSIYYNNSLLKRSQYYKKELNNIF